MYLNVLQFVFQTKTYSSVIEIMQLKFLVYDRSYPLITSQWCRSLQQIAVLALLTPIIIHTKYLARLAGNCERASVASEANTLLYSH